MSGHVGRSAQGQIRQCLRELLEAVEDRDVLALEGVAIEEHERVELVERYLAEIARVLRDESGIDWPT